MKRIIRLTERDLTRLVKRTIMEMESSDLQSQFESMVDEMVEIGRKTGLCCICGRSLDDEKSVEAGIGPVCAKKVLSGAVTGSEDEKEEK